LPDIENYLNIAGNPVYSTLNYSFGIGTYGRLSFTIHNEIGQVVYQQYYKRFDKGQYQKTVDLAELNISPGFYILTMHISYASYSQKFLFSP